MLRSRLAVLAITGTILTASALAQQPDRAGHSEHQATRHQAVSTRVAEAKRGLSVRLSGEVVRVIDRDEFRLSDGTGSIPVYLPWDGPSLVKIGDAVVVEGVVDDDLTFGLSRPEVYATTIQLPGGATMSFAKPAEANDRETTELSREPANRDQAVAIDTLARGQAATIAGRVVRILDTDEFRLEDDSGSVRVYIGWRNRMPVEVGARVTVTGVLDDDPWPIRAEFYADAITLEDGRSVGLRGTAPQNAEDGSPAAEDSSRPAVKPEARTPIQDLQPYNIVLIEGVVDRITDEDEFRIRDDSGSVRVYIGWRNRMPVRQGETVSVIGIVDGGPIHLLREVYAYELTTGDGRVVKLQANRIAESADASQPATEAARPESVADAQITPVAEVRRGQSVAIRGEVIRIRDSDEFVLRDDSGRIEVYIGWRNRMPVQVGDQITVFGTADDDVFPGRRPDIYADRIALADGRVVPLLGGGYDDD